MGAPAPQEVPLPSGKTTWKVIISEDGDTSQVRLVGGELVLTVGKLGSN